MKVRVEGSFGRGFFFEKWSKIGEKKSGKKSGKKVVLFFYQNSFDALNNEACFHGFLL